MPAFQTRTVRRRGKVLLVFLSVLGHTASFIHHDYEPLALVSPRADRSDEPQTQTLGAGGQRLRKPETDVGLKHEASSDLTDREADWEAKETFSGPGRHVFHVIINT